MRKPQVGEVWTERGCEWECLKDLGDGEYVWLLSAGGGKKKVVIDWCSRLKPPKASPPAELTETDQDGGVWVHFTGTDIDPYEVEPMVYHNNVWPMGAVARARVDMSTFQWSNGEVWL